MDSFSFAVAVVVLLLIGFVIFAIVSSQANAERQSAILASLPDFTPSVSHFTAFHGAGIALDVSRSKFMVSGGGRAPRVYGFDDLVAVEVTHNGASITKTNRGSQVLGAAAGGILLGPVGLLVGGLSGSKRQEELIKKVSLKLFTKDLISPVEEIVFFDGGSVGMSAERAKIFVEPLDQWHGRFQTILQMKEASV